MASCSASYFVQQCGLTPRSSGPPTAWRTDRQALGLRPILRLPAGAPRCRGPLNSNVRPHETPTVASPPPRIAECILHALASSVSCSSKYKPQGPGCRITQGCASIRLAELVSKQFVSWQRFAVGQVCSRRTAVFPVRWASRRLSSGTLRDHRQRRHAKAALRLPQLLLASAAEPRHPWHLVQLHTSFSNAA